MSYDHNLCWSASLVGLAITAQAYAAPIEGEFASNAAALLVVLGVWAIFMGARNLRELRHKRMAPDRSQRKSLTPDRDGELPTEDS